jgi:4-hydroxy-3-methylbut-2-enyl diphosphate reductase
MKVNLAKSAGFCFGVKRALAIAIETAASEDRIYMLGDIVHNEDVVRQISEAGIKKIKKLGLGKGKTLLIRAHGTGIDTLEKARRLGYKVVDATCPMVKEIHRIARELEAKGHRIIVIGDKRHDEVQGIIGQLKRKAVVIDDIGNIPFNVIRRIQKGCVVVQSTQNVEKVLLIVDALKNYIRKLKFYNTICKPTRIKQEEIKMLPHENDVMLIIGSKNSANTKRLYEISASLNKKTYWIESKKELEKGWFKKAKNVGVTAGASTPDTTTQSVIKYLHSLP